MFRILLIVSLMLCTTRVFACNAETAAIKAKFPSVNSSMLHYACEEARKVGVPEHTVLAVMFVESTYRQYAHSDSSYGVMQINAAMHPKLRLLAWKKFRTWNLYDWHVNIWIGVRLLARLRAKSPDMRVALQKYNGTLKNWKYSSKVFAFQETMFDGVNSYGRSREEIMFDTLNRIFHNRTAV